MVKISNLKSGDKVRVNDEGVTRDGTVVKLNHEEGMALVDNGIQEFWYAPEDLTPIPLDEAELMKMGFEKEEFEGGMKYKKDSFRLVTPRKGDFSHIEMWWREDKRHFKTPLAVHELQNLHLDMTKVHLG
jgi:hypothetical protein